MGGGGGRRGDEKREREGGGKRRRKGMEGEKGNAVLQLFCLLITAVRRKMRGRRERRTALLQQSLGK